VSTPNYLIAHRALPIQAGSRPEALWTELTGPEWSTWLAMIGMKLKIQVRKVGIEGMALGKPVIARDGLEMIAMYFEKPEASGEPYFAVLARRAGEKKLRSFVFERGSTTPEEPVRVVMAEWRYQGPDNVMRIRMDVSADESLDACIARTVAVMQEKHDDDAPIDLGLKRGVPDVAGVPAKPRRGNLTIGLVVVAVVAVILVALVLARR
jgi:hypothetical protein